MIKDFASAFVSNALAGAVGSRRRGAAAGATAEKLDIEVIDGHGV
jgi:hypothetical protein